MAWAQCEPPVESTDAEVRQVICRAPSGVNFKGNAIAGVDVQPGDSARAIADMRKAGAKIVGS